MAMVNAKIFSCFGLMVAGGLSEILLGELGKTNYLVMITTLIKS